MELGGQWVVSNQEVPSKGSNLLKVYRLRSFLILRSSVEEKRDVCSMWQQGPTYCCLPLTCAVPSLPRLQLLIFMWSAKTLRYC